MVSNGAAESTLKRNSSSVFNQFSTTFAAEVIKLHPLQKSAGFQLRRYENCFHSLPQVAIHPNLCDGIERRYKITNSACPGIQDIGREDVLFQI